ncbi:MAG: histidine phosphatase family protein [Ardenticatenaceae bacterium]|nr:histidine phosphatase family protein [Ardenticatenaceae bacterium]
MRIYLVRHGQSRWQVERNDDDWNSPLTALGQQQAHHLATWLANGPIIDNNTRVDVQSLHASPLLRAQQTADPLTQALHLPLITDETLSEAAFLVSAHLASALTPAHYPPVHTLSETYTAFKNQAQCALANLVEMAENHHGSVLAIAHGGLISTVLRLAVGSDSVSFWLYNTTLNLIEWKRGRWHLVHLNFWDHLPPPLRTY